MTHIQMVEKILDSYGPLSQYGVFHVGKALGYKMSPSSARTRVSELVRSGRVVDTGERETTPSGRRAVVWATA